VCAWLKSRLVITPNSAIHSNQNPSNSANSSPHNQAGEKEAKSTQENISQVGLLINTRTPKVAHMEGYQSQTYDEQDEARMAASQLKTPRFFAPWTAPRDFRQSTQARANSNKVKDMKTRACSPHVRRVMWFAGCG